MPIMPSRAARFGGLLLLALCVTGATGCKGSRGKKSQLARWMDKPTKGVSDGKVIKIPEIGVKFEIPETLYVFRSCGLASHVPQGENKWIPLITCQSMGGAPAVGWDEGESEDEEGEEGGGGGEWAAEDSEEEADDEAEAIALTFYIAAKPRPLDERAVTWFENQYKEAGLEVDDISFNENYQKKTGIYSKLQVLNDENGMPSREIVQFMFPEKDVVFIARMDYPFGETRSVASDWQYILWNFEVAPPAE